MKLIVLTLHDGSSVLFGPGGLIIGHAAANPDGLQTEIYWGGQRRLVCEPLEDVVTAFEELESG